MGAWETGSSWKQWSEPGLGDEGTRILVRGLTRISIRSQLLERLLEAGRPEPPQLQRGGAKSGEGGAEDRDQSREGWDSGQT